MRQALRLVLLTLVASSCASPDTAGPAAGAPSISVEEAMRTFRAEQDRLYRGGCEEGADLAHRRRWIERFRELTRGGDPVQVNLAYGAWALLLTNLQNAGYEEGVGRESLPLFREWAERYPTSRVLGDSLWMLADTAPDDRIAETLGFLEALDASPTDAVARGALAAHADLLEYLERADEATPLLEQIVRRWPGSFEARLARRDLRALALVAGVEAPAFALRNLQGDEVSLASLRGRVTLLYFFSFG